MSGLLNFDPWAAIGLPNPHAKEMAEAAQRRLDAELRRAERDAIENEPASPPPGSEARKVVDLNHEQMVRGLLLGVARERKRLCSNPSQTTPRHSPASPPGERH